MEYSSLITIPILSSILLSIYLLGRYVTISHDLFATNPYASWVIGAIVYFGITFGVFFPFLFFNINTFYFTVIFFIKEIITYLYIFLRREVMNTKINFKAVIWIVSAGILIAIIYHFGISKIVTTFVPKQETILQSWFIFKDVLHQFSIIPIEFLNDWLLSILAGTIAFATVTSFIIELAKKHNVILEAIGFIGTLGTVILFSHGTPLHHSIGMYFLLFSVIVVIRVIIFSRRRYATIYGIITAVSWTFDPNLFFAILILAFVASTIYVYLRRPKSSLFWTQLMVPLAIVASLWTVEISKFLTLGLIAASVIIYLVVVGIGRNRVLERLNKIISKLRLVIPVVIFLATVITSVIVISNQATDWMSLQTMSKPLFVNDGDRLIYGWIQFSIYVFAAITIVIFLLKWMINKKQPEKNRILIMMIGLVILFVYNPLVDAAFIQSSVHSQFAYLRDISITPLFIFIILQVTKIRLPRKKAVTV